MSGSDAQDNEAVFLLQRQTGRPHGRREATGCALMRILFVGDVVGRSGRAVVYERLPGLIRDWQLDLVVVNGENAAGGFGITEAIYRELVDAGADAITLGNHAWDQKEALVFIERAPRLIRPLNYPPGTPGRGAAMVEAKNGARALVVNAMGRIFMDPLDDPFAAIERELAACRLGEAADAIVIDFHGEATSEKQAMGFFCDGRASLVVGTHTHVPTADQRILPGGTAFASDVGMTGDYDSVIGMTKEEPLQRFVQRISTSRFEPASGPATLCALAVETDPATGLAARVGAVRLGGGLEPAAPAFWA
jgi:2',3'-cyclic-nucleotide 2'-phosphodiesterase